jgi:hypothetical protein
MKKPLFIVLTVLVAFSFGCGKSEKTYKTPEGEVKVKQKSGEVTYEATGKDGEKVTVASGDKGIALPADFPKDVPIIKGATVKVAMTRDKQMMVHLYVAGPVADAAKFYSDELKSQGWAIESTIAAGDVSMLSAKKGNRQCSVTAAKEGDGTLVQLAIAQEGS